MLSAAALGVFAITNALAVHDFDFQLDGDVAVTPTTCVGDDPDEAGCQNEQNIDWASIFDSDGVDQDPFPSGFSNTAFAKDFQTNQNGSFNTSDPSTFATGSKDTLPITPGWQCNADNNVNSKTDVMNSYAVEFDASGDDVMYFALERNANTGDGNVGFWFLQDDVGCDSSQGGTGSFTGDHLDGDVLIVSEFSNGGSVASIFAYRWNRFTGDCLPTPQPNCVVNPDGVPGFLGTTPIGSGGDCTTNTGQDDICATVNKVQLGPGAATAIPWSTANKQDGVGHTLRVAEFFEGGINLSNLGLGNKCFNTFIGDTRSSTSLTATIFDYALGTTGACTADVQTTPKQGDGTAIPDPFTIPGDPNDAALAVQDDAALTVTGVDTFSGTLTFYLCGPFAESSTTLCNDSGGNTGGVEVSSQTVTTSGTYSSADATVTAAGRYCWRAEFSGDDQAGVPPDSDSAATECFVVKPRQPSLVTDATDGPVPFGQSISDTGTLTNTAHQEATGGPTGSVDGSIGITPPNAGFTLGGDAGGTITFRAYGPDSCTTVAFTSNPVSVSGNGTYPAAGSNAATFQPSAPGEYVWVAEYTGDSPNTLGAGALTTAACQAAPAAEKVTVQQIPTQISTTQRVYPNDSATVKADSGNLPAGGTVQFRLFNSLANCQAGDNAQTVGQDGLLYKESETVSGGANEETETTDNTTVAVSTSTTVYWLVTYATNDTAHTGRKSDCVESTQVAFTNDSGPGDLFNPSP